jgi:hypothetical protein
MNKKRSYHYFDFHFHKIFNLILLLIANKTNQKMSKSCETLVIYFDIYIKKSIKN